MPVKLKVSKETDPQWHHEYEFDQEFISMGRDPKNDLKLGTVKSAVSRYHAKLKRHGDSYQLIDLNSRNSTFLNNKKLKSKSEYNLENGDNIKICEFIIQFSSTRDELEHTETTVFSSEDLNPFIEDSQDLAAILNRIYEKYDREESNRKDDALQEAMQESLGNLKIKKLGEILVSNLQSQYETAPLPSDKMDHHLQTMPSSEHKQRFIDILLRLFVKLIQAHRQFRLEFIGETMVKSRKSFSIYDCTDEELKNYLFDPNISSIESKKIFEQMEGVVNEIMMHQVSMLDGYKASVNEGTKKILEIISPDILKKQLAEKKSIFKVYKLIQLLSDTHRELSQEDQGIIEKKYFRPGYVRSYNKRIDSARKKKTKS